MRPPGKIGGQASDHAHLEHLGRFERRQDRRQPPRQHRLARAERSDHQEIVAAGCRDFEHAFGGLLAFDVLQVGHRLVARVRRRHRPPQGLQTLEVVDELKRATFGKNNQRTSLKPTHGRPGPTPRSAELVLGQGAKLSQD
jgi:hypothetical protein